MKEQNSIEQPAALTEIPMLAEYDRELAEAVGKPEPGMPTQPASATAKRPATAE